MVAAQAHLARVVARDEAAERHARVDVDDLHDRLRRDASGVVEVGVHAVGRERLQLLDERGEVGPVVDKAVEAELAGEPVALLVGAHDADHARAAQLCELPGQRADSTGSCRHDKRLARLHVQDVVRADPGGQADDHRDDRQVRGDRQPVVGQRRCAILQARDVVRLHVTQARDVRAHRQRRVAALLDDSDRHRAHRLAERLRRQVLRVV